MKWINPPQLAQEIYDYLKINIPNIPDFWSEVVEENKDFLVFTISNEEGSEKYFNDKFQRVSFIVSLLLKKNNKINQLPLLYKIITTIINFKEGKKWKALTIKINNTYIQDVSNLAFITLEEMQINPSSQISTFSLSYLLEGKDEDEDKH